MLNKKQNRFKFLRVWSQSKSDFVQTLRPHYFFANSSQLLEIIRQQFPIFNVPSSSTEFLR